MFDVYTATLQQDGGPLSPSMAASVAAALPEKPPETGKHKRKNSRSFRSFVAMCESIDEKENPDPVQTPVAKFTVNMYNASKRQTNTRVS